MARRSRRTFTAEFKAKVVLDLLAGNTTQAEVCRKHQLSPTLLTLWKTTLLERLPTVFQADERRAAEADSIAELERLVGQQAVELSAPKKGLDVGGWEAAHRLQVVTALAAEYPVRLLCCLFGCPRAALYRPAEEAGEKEEKLRAAVRRLPGQWLTYGYRRITALLRRERWAVGGERQAGAAKGGRG
jgi:transposase-like protein